MGEHVQSNDAAIATKASHRWIWFVTGPTACGKTTVAKFVAERLNLTFLEGDDFHPRANVEKMRRGEGLTDADRADWLEALRDHESIQTPPDKAPHLVMTCSALKRKYRDVLREGSQRAANLQIRFIFLEAAEEVLVKRAAERKGHYAGPNLVHSQFRDLERPGPDEGDVVTVDVGRPMEETENEVLAKVEGMLRKDGMSIEEHCGTR
ncbi:P-loop containing nucleoside triphosphate hydrolase protein [Coniochaeta sp. 2T2.1]|nr:P-loop containing nucleoside triphosphate hydrolase protein [Coniochaeta sp. 2T2.1]